MDDELLHLIALIISKGDAALWVGPQALDQWSPSEVTRAARQNWRGVWAEPKEETLLLAMRNLRSGDRAMIADGDDWSEVIAVPDEVDKVLTGKFDWAGILPYFFLNGRSAPDQLNRRKRVDARRAKENLLEQLKDSTLFLTGLGNPENARETLEELSQIAPELRMIVFDPDPAVTAAIAGWSLSRKDEPATLRQIAYFDESLPSVLQRIETLGEIPQRPTIRIGSGHVPFQFAFQATPPIDQDFLLITSQDLAMHPDRDDDHLLREMIRGEKRPWPAFRRGLAWERPVPHRARITQLIQRWPARRNVLCVDIPGEPGSGLTTLLKQLAFTLADRGSLVLFHVGPVATFNLDRVRTFCDTLVGLASDVLDPAVVLVFDAPSIHDDATLTLNGIAHHWMERTDTRLLILRGIPISPGKAGERNIVASVEANPRFKVPRPKPEHVQRQVLDPVGAILSDNETMSLKLWFNRHMRRAGSIGYTSAIARLETYQSSQATPLLLCLYYLLYDSSFDAARSLGRHIYALARKHTEANWPKVAKATVAPAAAADVKLTAQQLKDWLEGIRDHFGQMKSDLANLEPKEGMTFLLAIAALGCLQLSIPRRLLEDVAEVPQSRRLRGIYELEKMGLTVRMTGAEDTYRYAPAAFYNDREVIQFAHSPLARLLLEWLASADGTEALTELANLGSPLLSELCECLRTSGAARLDEYPLRFLEPFFKRMGADQRQFAEEISVKYLRLQRRGGGELEDWKWRNAPVLLHAFGWLPKAVLQQDDVLLHSRGITTYKSIPPALDDYQADPVEPKSWRPQYEAALHDFDAAYAIAESGEGTEDLGNILVSMGTAKMWWSARERKSKHPDAGREPYDWKRLANDAQDDFALALKLRPDNRFALYGAAAFRLENAEWVLNSTPESMSVSKESALKDLETVLGLLSGEPEEYFRDEWESTRKRAIEALVAAGKAGLLDKLKNAHDELGYALEAMAELGGDLSLSADAAQLTRAGEIMARASLDPQLRSSALGDLIRYVLFSHVHGKVEDYSERLSKLKRLEKTLYMSQPPWLYDFAMLAFQTGDFRLSSDKFRELRRGRRFYEVPRERICFYRRLGDTRDATVLLLRVVSLDRHESWGRLVDLNFPESIRIAAKSFSEQGIELKTGMTTRCVVRLFSSGPLAEPPSRREALGQNTRDKK